MPAPLQSKMILLKIIFLISLAIYGVFGAFNHRLFDFINGANLLFHEAGHVFFGFFGEYVGVWGGTLLQLLIPGGLGVAFLVKRDKFAASIMFFWMGQNFVHISDYINDSRAQVLSYVGGDIHDWHYILTKAGILHQDLLVGRIAWSFSLIIMLGACLFGMISLWKGEKESAA